MLTCLIESSKVGRSQPEIVVRNVSSSVSCMVCQIKCHQYWPKSIDESIVYNGIAVTLTNEETFADYVLRTIHLRLVWPLNILWCCNSFIAPTCALTAGLWVSSCQAVSLCLLAWPWCSYANNLFTCFLEKDQERPSIRQGTTCCTLQVPLQWCLRSWANIILLSFYETSSGVGQTGTMIAIDIMLDHTECNEPIDIYHCVATLRTRCQKMVQSEVCNRYLDLFWWCYSAAYIIFCQPWRRLSMCSSTMQCWRLFSVATQK